MTAIVLPDIDRSTLEDLKRRMPSLRLSDIEIPSMEKAGRDADRAIDRMMGRSHSTVWPWIAAGIGIAAIVGVAAALMTWMRRPAWSMDRGRYASTTESTLYGRTPDTGAGTYETTVGTYDTGIAGSYDPTTSTTPVTDGGQP